MTRADADMLVEISDPDGVVTMLEDFGLDELAQYVRDKYWGE
jgi:hypothetical protein